MRPISTGDGGADGDGMLAVVAPDGDPAHQRLQHVPPPVPGAGEVQVAVHAAAVTPGELAWPERWPAVPAHDVSGVVTGFGPEVDGSVGPSIGDEVFALVAFDRPGAAAELVCVAADDVALKPRSVDHVAAAAVPLGALTAWQALFDHARVEPGQHVLVHGGAGGVGSYAVSLAAQHGATVTATASSRDLDQVRALGAHAVVDYRSGSLDGVAPVDVVVDTVGGEVTARSWPLLRPGGTLVAVAEEPTAADAARHDVRAVYFTVEPHREQLTEIARRVDDGRLRPAVGRVVALADAASALDPPAGTRHLSGRTVVRVRPTSTDPEETR